MVLLMDSDISGQRFILSAENRSYKEVLHMMADGFGKKPPSKKVTPFISALVWRLEAIKSWFTKSNPLITRETAKTALTKARFDNSKLPKFLPGFAYRPLSETIATVCRELEKQK